MLQHRLCRTGVAETMVDFVRDKRNPAPAAYCRYGCKLIEWNDNACRIGGARDNQLVGRRLQLLDRSSCDLVPFRFTTG